VLRFDDDEHMQLADALGIAPVDLGQGDIFEQVPRFIAAAQSMRDTMRTVELEDRLTRIEEKLAELLRRTEPA
jgi:hypothetical protein